MRKTPVFAGLMLVLMSGAAGATVWTHGGIEPAAR